MGDSPESKGWRYVFDEIEVDPRAHVLARAGQTIPVEPKVYALLLLLIERAGETVLHEELLDRIWGHRHVSPGVLTRAVAQLRRALGDDPAKPRFIQTVHTLGYRFAADVKRCMVAAETTPEAAGATSVGEARVMARMPTGRRAWWWAFPLVALAFVWAMVEFSRSSEGGGVGPVYLWIRPFQVPQEYGSRAEIAGLQSTISGRLASLPGLRVVSQGPGKASGIELSGMVRRRGASWNLDLQLRGEGRDPWRRSYPLATNYMGDSAAMIQLDILRELVPDSPLLPTLDQGARETAGSLVRAGERAKAGFLQQDARDAITSFRSALALDPGNAQAWCRLGAMYLASYFSVLTSKEDVFSFAAEAVEHGSRLDPGSIHCLIAQGELATAANDLPQARIDFQRAHSLDPAMYEPRMWLAETDEIRFGAARDMLVGLLRDFPDHGALYFKLIEAYALTGQVDEARKTRQLMLQRQPQVANVDWPTGWLESMYGQPAAAIRRYQALSAYDPGDRSYHVVAAATAASIGAVALAREELRAAGRMETSNYIEANVMLFQALGDPQRAVDWLRTAPDAPSLAPFKHALQAQSLELAGQSDAARNLYSQALSDGVVERDAQRIDDIWVDGQVLNWAALYPAGDHRRMEIVSTAKRRLDRYVTDGLGVPWVHYQAAQIAVLEGRTVDAMRELDAAIDAGFTEALALRRDLPWRDLEEDQRFVARKQRLDAIAREQRKLLGIVDDVADVAIPR